MHGEGKRKLDSNDVAGFILACANVDYLKDLVGVLCERLSALGVNCPYPLAKPQPLTGAPQKLEEPPVDQDKANPLNLPAGAPGPSGLPVHAPEPLFVHSQPANIDAAPASLMADSGDHMPDYSKFPEPLAKQLRAKWLAKQHDAHK